MVLVLSLAGGLTFPGYLPLTSPSTCRVPKGERRTSCGDMNRLTSDKTLTPDAPAIPWRKP